MAFSNIFYDKERVKEKIESDYDNLKYMVNEPGNGKQPFYIEDPQIRLQKFGANISDNMVDINSALIGLNKTLCRDTSIPNNGRNGNSEPFNDTYYKHLFPNYKDAITDETRASLPAWMLRGSENTEWAYLHENPQDHTIPRFANNISSRILEKDNYINSKNFCN